MIEEIRRSTRNTNFKCTRLLCWLGVILLLMFIIYVILLLTVFKVKDPTMTLNKISLPAGTNPIAQFGSNISMTIDVSIENPNHASFRFNSVSSDIYYRGILVGKTHGPPGRAWTRGTLGMKMTGEINTERMFMAPNVSSDIGSGLFKLDSYGKIPGRVEVLGIVVKDNVDVVMNCTASYNITSLTFQDQSCTRPHIDLKLLE